MLKLLDFSWVAAHSYRWLAWVCDAHLRLITNGIDGVGMEIAFPPCSLVFFLWYCRPNATYNVSGLFIPNCYQTNARNNSDVTPTRPSVAYQSEIWLMYFSNKLFLSEATWHNLNQHWPRSVSQYRFTRPWCVRCIDTLKPPSNNDPVLIYWGRDKMAAIFHTIFSNAFPWIKRYGFQKISSLESVRKVSMNNIPALVQIMAWLRTGEEPLSGQWWRIYASLGLDELKLAQFAMSETYENWLDLVNRCAYYAHQTRGIYHVLPW